MSFAFIPASEVKTTPPLVIALSGMSGSGKTYSALLIAKAIARARGGPVCGVCTEAGRMSRYKDETIYPELTPFHIGTLDKPYTSERFLMAVNTMIEQGAGCGIIDSFTDEWEGEGGVLPRQEAALERMTKGDASKRDKQSPRAWAETKAPHKVLHSSLITLPIPIILCHRAREKTGFRNNRFIDLGEQPIYDSRLEYDFTFHLHMDRVKQDGTYTLLKAGYKHERHVFPGGKVDDAAIARLLETYGLETLGAPETSGETTQQPLPESLNAEVKWALDNDKRFQCSVENVASRESQKALFRVLRDQFKERARSKSMLGVDVEIATKNHDLIALLPEKGRKQIEGLVDILQRDYEEALL